VAGEAPDARDAQKAGIAKPAERALGRMTTTSDRASERRDPQARRGSAQSQPPTSPALARARFGMSPPQMRYGNPKETL
jgi:hypothetical protein